MSDTPSLTIDQLHREILLLKDSMHVEVVGLHDVFHEKFMAIGQKFTDLDARTEEQKVDTATAVQAALSAQKEAAATAALVSGRQLEQLSDAFTAALGPINTSLSDLKLAVGAMQSAKVGGQEMKVGIYAFAAFLGSVAVALAAVGISR